MKVLWVAHIPIYTIPLIYRSEYIKNNNENAPMPITHTLELHEFRLSIYMIPF